MTLNSFEKFEDFIGLEVHKIGKDHELKKIFGLDIESNSTCQIDKMNKKGYRMEALKDKRLVLFCPNHTFLMINLQGEKPEIVKFRGFKWYDKPIDRLDDCRLT